MRIPKSSFLYTTPIAHRGLHDARAGIPENSYAAFSRAACEGYAIETDVHLTADGQIAVFHDDDLLRMTGERGGICGKTFRQLSELRLLGTEERIPLFSEFLEFIGGKVPLLIEIKPDESRKELVEKTLATLKHYKGEFALQSFDPRCVWQIRQSAPEIPRGQLGCFYKKFTPKWYVVKHMTLNPFTRPDFISYNIEDLPYPPARRKNALLLCWTVRTQEEYERAKGIADNVIFENIRPPKIQKC